MAAMTQSQFVTELKARGWGRFTDPQLQKYLDWGLSEVFRRGNFTFITTAPSTATFAAFQTSMTLAVAGGGVNVHAIETFYVKDISGAITQLEAATDNEFHDLILPNDLSANTLKTTGLPTSYYVWDEKVYNYPAPPVANIVWYITATVRTDAFGGDVVSGLPERFDEAIVAFTEMVCNRRARDYSAMAIAETVGQAVIEGELATENMVFSEGEDRIIPYAH